jgi:hypothetical protein
MDAIDVTSTMGSDLPCMFNVVEATKMLGLERNLAHTQVSGSVGAANRRGGPIGWSLWVLRDELLKRFGAGCVTRSARVGDEAAPRPRAHAHGAGVRGGTRRRPGVRGGNDSVGRAGSPRLVPRPDQFPILVEV